MNINKEISPDMGAVAERCRQVSITIPVDNPKSGIFVMKKCIICGDVLDVSNFRHTGIRLQSYCYTCEIKRNYEYSRTKNGVVNASYNHQKNKSKKKNYKLPSYSRLQLKDWMFSQSLFHDLYDNWVNSGFNKFYKPSVDRIDDYKGYSLDNIQLMTWGDNDEKGKNDVLNGINRKRCKTVIQKTIDGTVINVFYSRNQASRETGIDKGNIGAVCLGSKKTAGGYKWEYNK